VVSNKKRLPQSVIDKWPEVFDHIDIKAIPLEYLHSIRVEFSNGKIWDVAVKDDPKAKNPRSQLERTLQDLFDAYEKSIKHVDFRVDTDRVKKDVQKRTRGFLKKNK
tara:strand:+ start:266 stop:586 length:321 start_codon:yes stop_codon:yes gene_type:complete